MSIEVKSDETPLIAMPGHLIRRLHQMSTAVFHEQTRAAGYDITSVQFAALHALRSNPGIDQATLASIIAYDRATIGGVIKRLLKKNLVRRKVHDEDRRARQLRLTKEGETLLHDITPLVESLQVDILGNLSPEDRAALTELLGKSIAG